MLRAALLPLLISTLARASTPYSVAVYPAPDGPSIGTTTQGINMSGQVAAGFNILSPTGAVPVPIPTGGSFAAALAINDLGQVTGYDDFGAIIATSGATNLIPVPAGMTNTAGWAINNSGRVAGTGTLSGLTHPFIGTAQASYLIPLPAGWVGGVTNGINSFGQVTGYGISAPQRAYIGTTSGSAVIPVVPGWYYALGFALNDSGQVAGYGGNNSFSQAFVGTIAGSVAIPLPPGATGALALSGSINNAGTVVGQSDAGGWMWDSVHGTVLLNTVVPAGWSVSRAISISNNGLILAVASYNSGSPLYVELYPTPTSGCQYSFAPPAVFPAANTPAGSVTVNTSTGCNWQAQSNQSWLTVISGASGSGTGTVAFSMSPNPGPFARVGTLTIGGATFSVFQSEPPPDPPIQLFPANGATGVTLSPLLQWNWSFAANSWDIFFGTSPAPPYVATVGLNYSPGPLQTNTTYYWRVVAHNSAGAATSPVASFTTLSPTCTFTLAQSSIRMTYQGGQAGIGVTAGSDCGWTAATNASWITITAGSGTGNGMLAFTVNVNNGPAQLATITLGNQVFVVMEGGSPASQFFNDVPTSDQYFDYVSLMNTDGITAGCSTSPSLYCPSTPVTRAQMSVFIVAAINRALGTSLTYTQTPYFQDVPSTSTYFPFVQRIKDLGITAGCSTSPALFCPDDSISQGQMAVFMIVGWMLENNLSTFNYSTTPYFTDVQPGDSYFKFVQKMRDLGIWMGCSQTQYCESSAVTRDQMAPMIMRSLLGAP